MTAGLPTAQAQQPSLQSVSNVVSSAGGVAGSVVGLGGAITNLIFGRRRRELQNAIRLFNYEQQNLNLEVGGLAVSSKLFGGSASNAFRSSAAGRSHLATRASARRFLLEGQRKKKNLQALLDQESDAADIINIATGVTDVFDAVGDAIASAAAVV